MPFCTNCGAENEAGSVFCRNCGSKLAIPRVEQPTRIERAAPSVQEVRKTSGRSNLLLYGVIGLLVLSLVVNGFLFLQYSNQKSTIIGQNSKIEKQKTDIESYDSLVFTLRNEKESLQISADQLSDKVEQLENEKASLEDELNAEKGKGISIEAAKMLVIGYFHRRDFRIQEFGQSATLSFPYLDVDVFWDISIPIGSEENYTIEINITDPNAKKDWWYKFKVNKKTGSVTYLSKRPA